MWAEATGRRLTGVAPCSLRPRPITVQNGWRYTEAQITLELQELNEVFNAENAPPVDGKNLAGTLAERGKPRRQR